MGHFTRGLCDIPQILVFRHNVHPAILRFS